MSNESYLSEQLLAGLRSLDESIKIVTDMYLSKGASTIEPVVQQSIENLKLQYVNSSLEGLKTV